MENAANIADESRINEIHDDLKKQIDDCPTDEIVVNINSSVSTYLSDVVSEKSYSLKYDLPLNDLPHNAYINKGITGCGGTTLAITNKENYVITVHSTNLITNKIKQYNHICGVFSKTTDDDIKKYLEDDSIKNKKFMVTYDSLPRLIEFIDVKEYRLLVDEVHVLIRYLGDFKTSVCLSLLESTYGFKSNSFLTATPTERCFLPEPLKKLKYVQYNWDNMVKPDIKHMYCGNQLQTKVVAFINEKLNTTDSEIYVFYNSRAGVATTVKKLLMIRDDLKISDINIVFSNNDVNTSYFRKALRSKTIDIGNKLVVDENGLPVPGHNKRINFISSFGFEGIDFYTHGKDVTTLVVADSSSKSMRYDIAIDIPQILGRFRRDKVTGLFPKNDIYFIWKSVGIEIDSDYDEIIKNIAISIFAGEKLLDNYESIPASTKTSEQFKERVLNSWSPYIIPDNSFVDIKDQVFIKNKYAMEGVMSAYLAMNVDYSMAGNLNTNSPDQSFIMSNLKTLCDKVNTFEIMPLSNKQSEALERKVGFGRLCEEYFTIKKTIDSPLFDGNRNECLDRMLEIRQTSDTLNEYLDYISIEDMAKYTFNASKIKPLIDVQKLRYVAKDYGIQVGAMIPYSQLKSIIQKMCQDNGIKKAVTRTVLLDWFEVNVNKTINGVRHYEILGEKK